MIKYPAVTYFLKLITAFCVFSVVMQKQGVSQFTPFSKEVHKIDTVEVVSNRNDFYGEDQKITELDTTLLNHQAHENLGELLTITSPLFIKSYGAAGSLSIPSLRGSSSNHTSLTWNGFPINSITLGQCDLATTPVEFMDKVSVTHGASGSLYGSGTFGGNIDLQNEVRWDQGDKITLASEYGSWNNQRYNLKALVGNNHLKYRLNGIYQSADNDFKYRDTQKFGNPLEVRKNNDLTHYGIMQNLFYQPSARNKLEAGVWYQVREKNIPALMGEYGIGTSSQKDSTIRVYTQWNRVFSESSLEVKTGYFYNYQLYTEKENPGDDVYSLYSPIKTNKWLNDANFRHYYSEHLTFDLGLQYSLLSADVSSYEKDLTEYRASAIGAIKLDYENFTTNLSVRQQFNNYVTPKPQVSLGMQYQLIENQFFIRSNFSTKYRIPTFNDKYWNPGGNKDIRPEHGWSGELGIQFMNKQSRGEKFTTELTGYTSRIFDLIQWVPKDGAAYWHAVNNSEVKTAGIEYNLHFIRNLHAIKANIRLMYNYTHSYKVDPENSSMHHKDLRYTPRNQVKSYTYFQYKKYTLGTAFQYTGSRYTSADNSTSLPGYFTTDVFFSWNIQYKNASGQLQFSVKNLFDNEYQIIANYPMPGRAYYIKLNIQLKNLFN